MNRKLLFTLSVLLMTTLACSVNLASPTATPIVIPTSIPTFAPPATAVVPPTTVPIMPTAPSSSGTILFQDDFSKRWYISSDSNGSTDYKNGGFDITVSATNMGLWSNPGQNLPADVVINVDVTKVGGPDDNLFGAICRYQDANNFYRLILSSDGYAGIGLRLNGTASIISATDGKIHPADGINQGAATNHIRAECIGNQITLYANGTELATATDSSITSGGDVGLMASAFSTVGVDMLFNNFMVTTP